MSDQGDAIRIVMERRKRQRRSKVILGGTLSVAGLSRVEEFIALSDKRVLPVRCHDWCCARRYFVYLPLGFTDGSLSQNAKSYIESPR